VINVVNSAHICGTHEEVLIPFFPYLQKTKDAKLAFHTIQKQINNKNKKNINLGSRTMKNFLLSIHKQIKPQDKKTYLLFKRIYSSERKKNEGNTLLKPSSKSDSKLRFKIKSCPYRSMEWPSFRENKSIPLEGLMRVITSHYK